MKLCYYQKLNYGAHDTTNEHRPLMYFCSSVKKTFNVCPEETKFSLFEHWLLVKCGLLLRYSCVTR